jgi:ParB-like chromosome segregation protein Spo0J
MEVVPLDVARLAVREGRVKICGYETHPAADAFPLLVGEEFDELVADIRENGQQEPIWLDQDGRMIDGRNRGRACEVLGIKPKVRTFKAIGPGHLIAFVWRQNIARRHLSASQRALATAKLAALAPGRPKAGQPAAMRQADAAKLAAVGERTTRRARQVLEQGVPELVAAVERGALSLAAAEEAARLAPEKQREVAAAIAAGANGDRALRSVSEPRPEPVAEPGAAVVHAIEQAMSRIGAVHARIDGRGIHVAFRDRVFLVQITQQARSST